MEDCVFCKIVRGEVPANKIAQDDDFVAFLGIYPKFPGMTVVVTCDHVGDSYLYGSLSDEKLAKFHLFTKRVALAIDKSLGSFRCIQTMEGMENRAHPHLKLFPVYEGMEYGVAFEGKQKVSDDDLKLTAEKIRRVVES